MQQPATTDALATRRVSASLLDLSQVDVDDGLESSVYVAWVGELENWHGGARFANCKAVDAAKNPLRPPDKNFTRPPRRTSQ